MGCGHHGGSGQNALRAVEWVCHSEPGNACLHLLLKPLPSPSLLLTGGATIPEALEGPPATMVPSSQQCGPTTPHITLATTEPCTGRREDSLSTVPSSRPIRTRDCLYTGIPLLEEEEEGLCHRKPIQHLLSTDRSSPRPIRTLRLAIARRLSPQPHTATANRHGSRGGQPIQRRPGREEVGTGGRCPPIGRACLRGGLPVSALDSLATAEFRSPCHCTGRHATSTPTMLP